MTKTTYRIGTIRGGALFIFSGLGAFHSAGTAVRAYASKPRNRGAGWAVAQEATGLAGETGGASIVDLLAMPDDAAAASIDFDPPRLNLRARPVELG